MKIMREYNVGGAEKREGSPVGLMKVGQTHHESQKNDINGEAADKVYAKFQTPGALSSLSSREEYLQTPSNSKRNVPGAQKKSIVRLVPPRTPQYR
jgi:hypothetical protein